MLFEVYNFPVLKMSKFKNVSGLELILSVYFY